MQNMPVLTEDKLKHLAEFEGDICITITMPCETSGAQQQQNPIRFKNLCQKIRKKLEKAGCDAKLIDGYMASIDKWQDENAFWKNQDPGLMVCISDDFLEFYGLQFELLEEAIVDRHFYLRDIIPHMQDSKCAAVLMLSMNDPKILFCTEERYGFLTKKPTGVLSSFDNYMGIFDREKSLQFHQEQATASGGDGAPIYHGQGAAGDDTVKKNHLKEYLKKLESWVGETCQGADIEEIYLVAEAQMMGLYKAVCHSSHPEIFILDEKNPEGSKPSDWIKLAQQKSMQRTHLVNLDILGECEAQAESGQNKVIDRLSEIIRAAHNSRIDTLLIPENDNHVWGKFDIQNNKIERQKKDMDASGIGDELINLAVIKTYLSGGKVYPMPNYTDKEYMAVCRW